MSLFLDIDRMRSAFRLLFQFCADSSSTETISEQFYDALNDITLGVQVPREALEKLRAIHSESLSSPEPLLLLAAQTAEDFRDDREVLVSILRIVLRLSNDDGLQCSKDKNGVKQLVSQFQLADYELGVLSASERDLLSHCVGSSACSSELVNLLSVLECSPEMSMAQIRRKYRMLVKKYHPDHASTESLDQNRQHFERIQTAYHAVKELLAA